MATPPVAYPFDPTGQAPSNKVTGEQIIVVSPGIRRYHFAVPEKGPFFEEGMKIWLRTTDGTVVELIKGKDYYLSHKFSEASLATMKPVWGSWSFLRRNIVGVLSVQYQTIGGDWCIDDNQIATILANQAWNPRVTYWGEVVQLPYEFPVIDHAWNMDDLTGAKEIVTGIEKIETAILSSLGGGTGGGASFAQHLVDFDNPHKVTAFQVGAYTIAQMDQLLGSKLGINATAFNSNRLDSRSSDQLKAWVLEGTAANTVLFNNRTYSELVAEIQSSIGVHAQTLGGKDSDAFKAWVLEGKAAGSKDADKFEGLTKAALVEELKGIFKETDDGSGEIPDPSAQFNIEYPVVFRKLTDFTGRPANSKIYAKIGTIFKADSGNKCGYIFNHFVGTQANSNHFSISVSNESSAIPVFTISCLMGNPDNFSLGYVDTPTQYLVYLILNPEVNEATLAAIGEKSTVDLFFGTEYEFTEPTGLISNPIKTSVTTSVQMNALNDELADGFDDLISEVSAELLI